MEIISGMVGSFLVALPALFSIVNPIGGALIYSQVTIGRPHPERVAIAHRVAFYSAMVMLASLWIGAALMSFFGVSIDALRVAGELVVAASAWGMLYDPKEGEDRKQEHATSAAGGSDIAFFPLTMPFTTGPGTISVAIALSASRPSTAGDMLPSMPAHRRRHCRRDRGRRLLRICGPPRCVARSGPSPDSDTALGFPTSLHRRANFDLRHSRRAIDDARRFLISRALRGTGKAVRSLKSGLAGSPIAMGDERDGIDPCSDCNPLPRIFHSYPCGSTNAASSSCSENSKACAARA